MKCPPDERNFRIHSIGSSNLKKIFLTEKSSVLTIPHLALQTCLEENESHGATSPISIPSSRACPDAASIPLSPDEPRLAGGSSARMSSACCMSAACLCVPAHLFALQMVPRVHDSRRVPIDSTAEDRKLMWNCRIQDGNESRTRISLRTQGEAIEGPDCCSGETGEKAKMGKWLVR